MSESLDAGTPAAAPGAGARLRAAREAQGVHVAALAVALKVPVRQLEALETDRLDLLPDLTFARALTSSVCRQLRIDPAPMLEALPRPTSRVGSGPEPLNETFSAPGGSGIGAWREQLVRPPVAVALVLLLGAVILLALPVLREQWPSGPEAGPVPAPAAAPVASAPAPAEPAASGLVTESVQPALPAAPAASGASLSMPAPSSPVQPSTPR